MGLTTLHITNWYHPTSGGIRTFYHALIEAGNAAGRYVRLLVPGSRSAVEDVGRYGRIYQVPAPPAPAFDRRYRMIGPHSYLPWLPSAVVGVLERERPDVVEISDKFSLPYLAAMLRKGWHPRVPRPVLVGLTCERFDDNMAAWVSSSTLAHAFTRCDVFVHSNPREPFGIGPLEAMASGVPVVVPNAGGVLEYASPANAWLAEPTGAAFADAIRAACRRDPARLAAARETVGRFRWRDATLRYFDAYDDLSRRFSVLRQAGSRSRRAPAA